MTEFKNAPVRYARFTKSVTTQPLFEDGVQKRNERGDYLAIRETKTYGYDSLLRKWIEVDIQKEILTPIQCGLTQHGKLKIVFQRSGKNDLLETIYKYFVIECSVDFKASNRHEWVSISNGQFWLHNLQEPAVALLAISSPFIKKSKPKPISEKAVLKMLKTKQITHVYEADLRTVCLFKRVVKGA